jgi:hypothetical protein
MTDSEKIKDKVPVFIISYIVNNNEFKKTGPVHSIKSRLSQLTRIIEEFKSQMNKYA